MSETATLLFSRLTDSVFAVPCTGGLGLRLRRALPGRGLFVIALALFLAPPALGTPLLPSPNPLPRSTFQGADGNQNNTLTLIDWQRLSADGRVGHTSDNNPEDTAFAGGSKENQPDGGTSRSRRAA